jgi:putative chitinase
MNELADKGDFLRITKVINGGTNGYDKRLAYYERAKGVFV